MNSLSIKDTLFIMCGVSIIVGALWFMHQPAPHGVDLAAMPIEIVVGEPK